MSLALILPLVLFQSYDVASLLRTIPEPENPTRWSSHLGLADETSAGTERGRENPFWAAHTPAVLFGAEDLQSLIRAHVTPSAWSKGEGRLDLQDNVLWVEAPAATHAEIQRFLRELDNLMEQQKISLKVDLLRFSEKGRIPSGARLDAATTQKLASALQSGNEILWSAEGSVFSGYALSAHRREERSFLRGYEIEVATKAKGVQPVIGLAANGPAVIVRPTRVESGGRVHLSYLLDASELTQMERFETRSLDTGNVQIPHVRLCVFAGNAVLGWGESLLLSLQGETNLAFWVRLGTQHPKNPESGEWTIFDPRFLFDRTGRFLPSLGRDLGEDPADPLANAAGEPFSQDFVSQIFPSPENPKLRSTSRRTAGGIFLRQDDEQGQKALREAYLDLERQYTEAAALELLLTSDPQGGAQGAILQTRLPVTQGRFCGVLAGRESNYVSGYRIQIAQESTIAGPVLRSLFEGLQFRAKFLAGSASKARVLFDLRTNAIASTEIVRSGLQNAGDFLSVEQHPSQCVREVDLPWDALVPLGEVGPIQGASPQTRVFAFLKAKRP